MTEVLVNKMTLIGTGYAELHEGGRRWRFLVERYRHDDGTEFGQIVSKEEIPDVGPMLWIPSWGSSSPDEAQYLRDEYEHEKAHPDPGEAEWWSEHRANTALMRERYDEARDERAKRVGRNPKQFGG